jgi:cytochrome P450
VRAPDQAPGPPPFPVLGVLPELWFGERIDVHAGHVRAFGDVIRYRFGPVVAHMVLHPDDVKHVLQENHANYVKGRGTRRMRLFLGQGLLTSEGELWRRQRRLAQPAFHPKRVAALVDSMVDATNVMLAAWTERASRDAPIDVAAEMMRLTLDVVGRTLFGADLAADADAVYDALTEALSFTVKRLMVPFAIPLSVPIPSNRRFLRARATLDQLVFSVIEARRKSAARGGADLLAMLMDARDEETGEAMSDTQLRDEVMTLVLAGHETTANALAWTFLLLSREPIVWRALRAEVNEVLGDRRLTADDLPKLRYTRMVLEESMRLYPPAWMFGRTAIAEDTIRGYRIPPGSIVILSPFYTHRHADVWPNPEGFDPERFAPDAASKRHKYAYLPFGGGPRICIGNGFALVEAQAILATITQRFRVDVTARNVTPEPIVTLRPKGGVPARLRSLAHMRADGTEVVSARSSG